MTKEQKKILGILSNIMKPKQEHIENLQELCKDERRSVAKDFLAMYTAEYQQYMELKMALIEEFNK